VFRIAIVGVALLGAQDRAGSAVDIRQLNCNAVATGAAAFSGASSTSADGGGTADSQAGESRDHQDAILSDPTINGPARVKAVAGDAPQGQSATADGEAASVEGPAPGGTPAGAVGGRCDTILNPGAGAKSRDVKILQVSPADVHR